MGIISFPIIDDEKNNLFKVVEITKEKLISKLYLLLLTDSGSVYYNREFGTNLRRYMFEPNDNVTSEDIQKEITSKVNKYIPELRIRNVEINPITDDNLNKFEMVVKFVYSDNSPDAISITF